MVGAVAGAVAVLIASFALGRQSAQTSPAALAARPTPTAVPAANANSSACDRPSYKLTIVPYQGLGDAVAAIDRYFPNYAIVYAYRYVYVDSLKLCRVDLRATNDQGVGLKLGIRIGAATAAIAGDVAGAASSTSRVLDVSHSFAGGSVVAVELSGPPSATLPSIEDLERFITDPGVIT